MSSADPIRLPVRDAHPVRFALLRCLIAFAVVNAILALCFRGSVLGWVLVLAIECALLAIDLMRARAAAETARQQRESAARAAELLKDASLDASELRQLSGRMSELDAHNLAQALSTSGGAEVQLLTRAFNAMRERLDEQFKQQQRLTADTSHELRTPITTIRSNADMLNRWAREDPVICQECIDTILHTADEMSAMVTDQLAFAVDGEKKPLRLTRVDLTALVTSLARETRLIATEHRVEAEIALGVAATADKLLIKQCLRDLCENAVKYTPEGGTITLSLTAGEGVARLSVRDTGIGIPGEDIPHLFEPYYRSDAVRSYAGTGLGLATAHRIALRHKGRIEVESALGEGSTFTLVLPLEQETT